MDNSVPRCVAASPSSAQVRVPFISKAKREENRLEEEKRRKEQKQAATASSVEEKEGRKRNRESDGGEEDRRKRVRLEERAMVEAIKEQRLGYSKPKKRVMKPSDKLRFRFEWEKTEDTSRDGNILYPARLQGRLLFGSGYFGGIDRGEQRKKNDDVYDDMRRSDRRHWSEKEVDEMSERDWRIFREDFNISYNKKGGVKKIPNPMRSWGESKLNWKLLRAVERAGYKSPSPIQMATIPLGLQQLDVIGIAQTGSGKTVAFVLPMLNYISRLPPLTDENKTEGPYALVMAPTRELAQQIEEVTIKFAHYMGGQIKVVSIVGGQSIEEQAFKVRNGCHVVIATPGRLLDCLKSRYIVLNQCNYVVLDEADRLIDMGFEPQVVDVLDAMPSTNLKPLLDNQQQLDEKKIYRITYMFSATMPPGVERLARKYLRNPVVATIGKAAAVTDHDSYISQHVIMIKESEKFPKLRKLLDDGGTAASTIVFVNTKKNADFVTKQLDKAGYKVTSLHGGKSQDQREVSLERFRSKRYTVLVATDVAGRGIDIPDVAHVINYDLPGSIDMYTHRIGRTGRAGKMGAATTFLTLADAHLFYDLKQMLLHTNSPVPWELARHQASKFKTIPPPPRPNRC